MSAADTPQEENKYPSLPEDTEPKTAEQTEASAEIVPATDASNTPQLPFKEDTPAQEPLVPSKIVSLAKYSLAVSGDELHAAQTTSSPPQQTKLQPLSSPAEVANLMALNQELRQRNRELLSRINQLEQALLECKEVLQSQLTKSQTQEALFAQTSQELVQSQEQASRLFRELEASHQAAQRQQILIETLTQQLEGSQERIAQMERECSAIQQRYNEQSHQLSQSENITRELRSRLQRQQRQTLQFKAALERCLDVPTLNDEISIKDESTSSVPQEGKTPTERPRNSSPISKAQPIQPWSAQSEFIQPPSTSPSWFNPVLPLSSSPLDFLDWEVLEENESEEISSQTIAKAPTQPAEADVLAVTTHLSESELQLSESEPETLSELLNELESILPPLSSESEASQELVILEEVTEGLEDTNSAEELPENPEDLPQLTLEHPSQPFVLQPVSLLPASETTNFEVKVSELMDESLLPEEDPAEFETDASRRGEQMGDILSQPNWPSPLVYPLRPPKGRKSLAAIELPSFPRRRN